MKFNFKLFFTLALTVLLIAFVAISTTFNSQARMMPLIIGVPVMLLALAQLFVEVREAMRGKDETPQEVQVQAKPAAPGHRHTLVIYAWIAAMFGALYLVGFVVTTFFYPLLYMRFVGHRSWRLAAGISLGAFAFLYIVMIMGLQVDLYEGVIVLALRKAYAGY